MLLANDTVETMLVKLKVHDAAADECAVDVLPAESFALSRAHSPGPILLDEPRCSCPELPGNPDLGVDYDTGQPLTY